MGYFYRDHVATSVWQRFEFRLIFVHLLGSCPIITELSNTVVIFSAEFVVKNATGLFRITVTVSVPRNWQLARGQLLQKPTQGRINTSFSVGCIHHVTINITSSYKPIAYHRCWA
jgi:hypothetical protein